MNQIFAVSTLFGAMTVSAAIDAGLFGPRTGRRILVVSNNAPVPEIVQPADELPGFEALRHRFDEVRSWNAVIDPMHPADFVPAAVSQPMLERLLRESWRLGAEPVELVAETISFGHARSLSVIFHDAPITIYTDGLMSYGPTRAVPPPGVGSRITRQIHLDLVPGLEPHLLEEYGVPVEVLAEDAFVRVVEQVGEEVRPLLERHGPIEDGVALIVGQYLSALEILTAEEEEDFHVEMLSGVVARGHRTVLFKPHPTASTTICDKLVDEAKRLGVRLEILDDPVPAEVWCAQVRPALVVGCFSTALVTANRYFGLPAATLGAIRLLRRLLPYANSNRIPLTIIDSYLPRLTPEGELVAPPVPAAEVKQRLVPLLTAVAYCMQPGARPDLRRAAIEYLETFDDPEQIPRRYFRPMLYVLDLPGANPPEQEDSAGLRRIKRFLSAGRR